jgi:hypothetical protein
MVVAVPVAVWGHVGEQNASGMAAGELDHAVRPWDMPGGVGPAVVLPAAYAADAWLTSRSP